MRLRKQAGIQALSVQQAERILENTAYMVTIQYHEEIIGVTRLLFDFCTDAYITDVIVSPEYQGQGLGRILISDMLEFIKAYASEGTRIACSLYANQGKEEFYRRFGFEKLPNGRYGFGMILEV